MNITRRRGAIATFITLGVLTVGLAVTLNITAGSSYQQTHRRDRRPRRDPLQPSLIAGVVLNTVFLIREIRRNERQDSFLNAVTHELKTPIASIRLYLETLQRRPLEEASASRVLQDHALRLRPSPGHRRTGFESRPAQASASANKTAPLSIMQLLLSDCIAITVQRHHLPVPKASSSNPYSRRCPPLHPSHRRGPPHRRHQRPR